MSFIAGERSLVTTHAGIIVLSSNGFALVQFLRLDGIPSVSTANRRSRAAVDLSALPFVSTLAITRLDQSLNSCTAIVYSQHSCLYQCLVQIGVGCCNAGGGKALLQLVQMLQTSEHHLFACLLNLASQEDLV